MAVIDARMAAVRFCPRCGVETVPRANFCAACGEALPGAEGNASRQTESPPAPSWRMFTPGLLVLAFYLMVGTGLWLFVLRSQPFPAATTPAADGQASTGGSVLPQNHPQVTLPDEVTKRIAELVEQANAAPTDVQAWKTLAEVQSRAARIDASYRSAALSSYRHILDLAPNDLDALRGIGNIYYDFEEYAKAIEYYRKYLTLNPDDPNVRTDLGTMHLYSNDINQAIAEYQTVLAKQPAFFQAHFNLGIAYHEQGKSEKARESLLQARTLTTDQNIRTRIDQVLTQFGGSPSVATAVTPTDAVRSPFQQAVEKLFRSHEIMGPRISRIEWPAPVEAQVFLQNFPMAGMPPEVRERFLSKLRAQVTEAKSAAGIGGVAKIELIDADTQQIMETINT